MDTLYIIIPAYNEEANISEIIREWYPVIEERSAESKLVIIDDGSRDATWQILQEEAKLKPKLTVLTKPNGGHGATILYGYRYALRQGADYVFQTDSDGQTLPSEFAQFWEKREEYAMVIGKRSGRQDGRSRKFVSFVLRMTCLICFQVHLADVNTPYRLMKAERLAQALERIPENYNLANVMVSVIFAKKRFGICYLPITFRPRQGGVNSINMKKIFRIGVRAVKDFAYFSIRGFR